VLYQLALLTWEVADLSKMLEHQPLPGSVYSGSVPDIAVAKGPLESVSAVHVLDAQCT